MVIYADTEYEAGIWSSSMNKNIYRYGSGFTLIELMMVVVIIGILSAIAYPAYLDQMRKGHRRGAQAWLMELATKQQQRYTDLRSYTADLSGWSAPSDITPFYTFTATVSAGPPAGFTLTATPVTGTDQVNDGALSLTSDGTKSPADKW